MVGSDGISSADQDPGKRLGCPNPYCTIRGLIYQQ